MDAGATIGPVEQSPKCRRCARGQRGRPKLPGGCRRCGRWQFLEQLSWAEFPSAVHRHLACVECGSGAWCRDFVVGPDRAACATQVHVHGDSPCAPILKRVSGGRWLGACAFCARESVPVAAVDPERAWRELVRIGWAALETEPGAATQALCKACAG